MKSENPKVSNVPDRFKKIPTKVRKSPLFGSTDKYLGALADGKIPRPDYTSHIHNRFGSKEHFQGIQRIGKYLILSGGIKTGEKRSQLIVIEMESQQANGPWALPYYLRSNGHDYKAPSPKDRIVSVKDVDKSKWHVGGIQASGEIVALPIYGETEDSAASGSEIRYFDLSNPEGVIDEMKTLRLLKSGSRAKAVALTRLHDGHYMTLTWDDNHLDFHRSQETDIQAGFISAPQRVHKDEVRGGFQPGGGRVLMFKKGTYQNINFIRNADDTVYFVATRNQRSVSPTLRGKDFADLYKVEWPDGYLKKPVVSQVDHRQFYCYNQQSNFGAGAGIYVDDADHIFLYGCAHWLHGGSFRLNFNEYSYA